MLGRAFQEPLLLPESLQATFQALWTCFHQVLDLKESNFTGSLVNLPCLHSSLVAVCGCSYGLGSYFH